MASDTKVEAGTPRRMPETLWVAKFPKRINEALKQFPSIISCFQIMSGAPCVARTRIPVWVLSGRYAAGESLQSIANDYELRKGEVVDAIRFSLWIGNIESIKFWKFYRESPGEENNGR
jgi:uncharacterized protein (DUF433 family)